jgi:ketosteroid isomerase-like protein
VLRPVKRCAVLFLLAAVAELMGCGQRQVIPPGPGSGESAGTIRALSISWFQAMNARDLEKTLSYYAPDATIFPPGAGAASTADLRRQVWSQMLGLPGFHLDLTASSVETASGGDLAVETGAFVLSADDKQGKPTATRGKYVCVWKRQPDGSWKAYQDIWNVDQ